MIFNNVYKGKTVLITGHSGFKGSWLSIWLRKIGANVVGYSLPPETTPSNFESSGLEKKVKNYFGDMRNYEQLSRVVTENKPDFIFHLASQPLVRRSYLNPKDTFETNMMGLINLLEIIRQNNLQTIFINVTSDKCYENKEWTWPYREIDPLGGYDPYSASKACSEIITASYRNSFFNEKEIDDHKVAISTVRAGNVIGGGDWSEDRIIPDCVRSITNKKPIIIRSPNSIRPWQHVLEPLSGYLWLGAQMFNDRKKYSSAWNFGSVSVKNLIVIDLVKYFIKEWGVDSYDIQQENKNFHEATYLKLDSHKAINQLKWEPVLNIEKAVEMTAHWYSKFYSGNSDSYNLCLEQITDYERLINLNRLYGT